jgi:PAS domain S-box-containing protein
MSHSTPPPRSASSLDPEVTGEVVATAASRLQSIVSALPDAILCMDRSWHMTYANREAIRISRLDPELFARFTFWELYPGLIGSEMERRYLLAMSSGKPDQFEFYYQPFGVWVDIHILPTEEGFALCYRDITARKQEQQRESNASRQIRQLFEAMPDGVVTIDPEWRFTFANQRALEILGRNDIVGGDIFALFPGNAREPFSSVYRDTMLTRAPHAFEAFNAEPLNRWFRVQAKPFEEGIIVFFSDVSERKAAELREQETARRLAEVLELTSDGVFTLDRSWRYTFINSSAKRVIDRDDALLGRNIWEEFPWAVGGPSWEIYHRSMDERVPGQVAVKFPDPDPRWLVIHSQPAPDGIVVFFRDITEQRSHDQIVRKQQDLLTTVQAASRLATWEFDLACGSIFWGPGAFEIFGHPHSQMSSLEELNRILLPGHAQRIAASIDRAVATGQSVLTEFAVKAADGSTIWIESRGHVFTAPDGSKRLRGMSIDATQRHLDQQDLVASEARYRVLADLNPQAIWMGEARGKITYANHNLLAYLRMTADELGTAKLLTAFKVTERTRLLRAWARSVRTGADFNIEALLCHGETGEYRYWQLRAAPVRDASGAILHWLGVGQDVHETKTYTAALRAEQMETERRRAELETLYATSPIGLALLDPVEFRFLNLNDREAEMLGAPREQLLGQPLSQIAPPEKLPGLFNLMRTAASGTPVRDQLLEGELASRPGERRAFSVNYAPIYNQDGTVRAISTASIEITHQKRAEAALIQSEKLAAVGRLASSISHEINNPLEAITNLLYLISLDPEIPGRMKVYVQMAQAELSRVSQIATQTLRFHRQAVAPTLVTPADLVDAVIRLYTGRLANSSIQVDTRYATSTAILCFENDIRQVLNNLIANAIDAMRRGGRLVIRAHDEVLQQDEAARPGVRITVADTGHGMSPETMSRIFEPFFTTKDLNGTGLGLWISAGIVERHHGRIRVRSSERPGRSGTVFSLFLPCDGR